MQRLNFTVFTLFSIVSTAAFGAPVVPLDAPEASPMGPPSAERLHLTQSSGDATALVTALQLELNRLGCGAGKPDGIWGRGSRGALDRLAQKIGASDLGSEPSDPLLETLRAERGQPCTLPPGVVAAADRSETYPLEAVRYSYKVWSSMPSRVASQRTEYGVLTCKAGSDSKPRECSWE